MRAIAERQGINKKSLCRYSITLFVVVLCLQFTKFVSEVLVNDYFPTNYWFEYKKIETELYAYPVGTDEITVKSYSIWKRNGIDVEWSDTLFCIKNAVWVGLGNQYWRQTKAKEDNSTIPQVWLLKVPLPDFETKCKLKSDITVLLPYTTKPKKKTIFSNEFLVIDSEFSY